MNTLQVVEIYTDGARRGNPGPGGWAALLRTGDRESILSGSSRRTTNNRMELTAAVEALKALKKPCKVYFYTDSNYVKRGVTEWLSAWKSRKWKRKGGELANVDLWQALDRAMQPHKISWRWVRAHAGQRDNERVDHLARQAIP